MKIIIWIITYLLLGIAANAFVTIIMRIRDKAHRNDVVVLEDGLDDCLNHEVTDTFKQGPAEALKVLFISFFFWPITIPIGIAVAHQRYLELKEANDAQNRDL